MGLAEDVFWLFPVHDYTFAGQCLPRPLFEFVIERRIPVRPVLNYLTYLLSVLLGNLVTRYFGKSCKEPFRKCT